MVKVKNFIFAVDFVILDMDLDVEVPLILGRPFLATARALIDVAGGKLVLRVGEDELTMTIPMAMKQSLHSDDSCFSVDTIDMSIVSCMQDLLSQDALELSLRNDGDVQENSEAEEMIAHLGASEQYALKNNFEKIEPRREARLKPSIEEPPVLELKQLPKYLEYVFLEEDLKLPVIIASGLSTAQKDKLLKVLKKHKRAIAWKISDIQGISPSFCTHKILLEEDFKPVVQPQRRLNPNMKDVVKKEVIKLLDAGMIYPISDSSWVSPVQVVPKQGGMMVVPNEKNELIPMRTVTGW